MADTGKHGREEIHARAEKELHPCHGCSQCCEYFALEINGPTHLTRARVLVRVVRITASRKPSSGAGSPSIGAVRAAGGRSVA